eukprot:13662696-Alexandrium_andersonii.AAC.1
MRNMQHRFGVRTWNCAGPGTASKLAPEAPKGCILRQFSRRSRICPADPESAHESGPRGGP